MFVCLPFILSLLFFFFNDTATTEIYTYLHTLSLHDALPIYAVVEQQSCARVVVGFAQLGKILLRHPRDLLVDVALHRALDARVPQNLAQGAAVAARSEEHPSELQSLMRISYAVFCLKKKKNTTTYTIQTQ